MIDQDISTLHIRCGSDIRDSLRQAGFAGDFLEYADPVCQGPVPDQPNLTDIRAKFLADAYGSFSGKTEGQIAADLRDGEIRLAAAHRYQRVVLWFEHDSFDQMILARCLSCLALHPLPGCLELICIDRHPSVARFIGLGQLTPEALASLWLARAPVTSTQLHLGTAIWQALRRPDPCDLSAIAANGTPALPFAAAAIWRHLQELPGAEDGLSLTQRLVLQIIAERPATIGQIFAELTQCRETLPFLGDAMLLHLVRQMARTRPAVLGTETGGTPFQDLVTISETGQNLLAGRGDYLTFAPPERWVGGIAADGRWRWHDNVGGPVCVPPPD
ncbi:DUF1835 domain-containing protein [Rhodopila sp.]|uniref:DUF1835 domain-containing protein n=1 Tax=Rhodopila sp. TaxID=2480087 RepID=UPI003D0CB4DF